MGNPQLCKAEDFYVLMCQVGFSTLNIAPKPQKIIEASKLFSSWSLELDKNLNCG